MSQNVIATNNAAAPLAVVTKSRASLENSLNNNASWKKDVPAAVNATPAATPTKVQPVRRVLKTWSSMNSHDLAQLVSQGVDDEDEEDTVMPSRRRAPPPKGAATTVTSYANTSIPTSPVMVQAPTVPHRHVAPQQRYQQHKSQPTQQHFRNSSVRPVAQQQQSQQIPKPRQQQQQPVLPTFDQSVGHLYRHTPAPRSATRSATPPSLASPTAIRATSANYPQYDNEDLISVSNTSSNNIQSSEDDQQSEVPFVVNMYRNDPYNFNVLGDNQTVEARKDYREPSARPMPPAFPLQSSSISHHDASFYSESDVSAQSTVGYVNSAEVSPVKHHQQQRGSVYSEHRRSNVAAMAANFQWPSTPADSGRNSPLMQHQNSYICTSSNASPSASVPSTPTVVTAAPVQGSGTTKVKRVYVNGRPVITGN